MLLLLRCGRGGGGAGSYITRSLQSFMCCFLPEVLQECYRMDANIAMGIIERREDKWDGLDCLEIARSGTCLSFVSSPASQGTIELTWRRGMSKAPFYGVMIANVMPLLIYFTCVFR